MGQPQRASRAPIAIALAVIAGFVVMVMIGISVLGGVWLMRASTLEDQVRRERTMVEEHREVIEQLQQERAKQQALAAKMNDLQVGDRLQVERPRVKDEAEIVEIVDEERVKIRWLSGQPGEEVVPIDRLWRETK